LSKLIFLGTASAVPDEEHENTHMVVAGKERTLLIDSVGNSIMRLKQAGVDHNSLTDLLLTHFHPDHTSGVPPLLMNMWLLGRQQALNIYGLAYTLERMEKVMEFYDWATWPNFFQVNFLPTPEHELAPVMDGGDFKVYASPVHHLVPTIGLRIEFPESGMVVAYSCDTEPCSEVVRLAQGADVLIHESAGETIGHTSAYKAGEIAREAGAKELYLIHYHSDVQNTQRLIAEAQRAFDGPVKLAEDLMILEF